MSAELTCNKQEDCVGRKSNGALTLIHCATLRLEQRVCPPNGAHSSLLSVFFKRGNLVLEIGHRGWVIIFLLV